jgi:hypothetical protein
MHISTPVPSQVACKMQGSISIYPAWPVWSLGLLL